MVIGIFEPWAEIMKPIDAFWCVCCVLLVSVGQVLLRAASMTASEAAAGWRGWISPISCLAVLVYASAMLAWLSILSRIPLTQAFAFFGLSFFIVPFLANRFLGDPVGIHTWLGACVIAAGIVITSGVRT